MRILMCSPNALVRELGAPKVLIELAEALREIGVTCDVVAPRDYDAPCGQRDVTRAERCERLREFLALTAAEYDVVEVDHEELPFPRAEFSRRPLIVARSVLLVDHLRHVPLGWPRYAWGTLRRWGRLRRAARTLEAC